MWLRTLSEALRAKGAIVAGFDSSPVMVELARHRLGEDADLRVADLSQPLPYADGSFDDVVVSLVLHYLQDWTAPLSELRRVLKSGGASSCRSTTLASSRRATPTPTTSP